MDDRRLERIESKLDDTNDHLAKIDITLAAQHESLKAHMYRTSLLEQELRPIKKHVDMVAAAIKLIGLLTALGACYEILKRIV